MSESQKEEKIKDKEDPAFQQKKEETVTAWKNRIKKNKGGF